LAAAPLATNGGPEVRFHLARVCGERKRNFVGQHFGARGYFVSKVGHDEQVIRQYRRDREKEDERLEQFELSR
jgi:putative transposase